MIDSAGYAADKSTTIGGVMDLHSDQAADPPTKSAIEMGDRNSNNQYKLD